MISYTLYFIPYNSLYLTLRECNASCNVGTSIHHARGLFPGRTPETFQSKAVATVRAAAPFFAPCTSSTGGGVEAFTVESFINSSSLHNLIEPPTISPTPRHAQVIWQGQGSVFRVPLHVEGLQISRETANERGRPIVSIMNRSGFSGMSSPGGKDIRPPPWQCCAHSTRQSRRGNPNGRTGVEGLEAGVQGKVNLPWRTIHHTFQDVTD